MESTTSNRKSNTADTADDVDDGDDAPLAQLKKIGGSVYSRVVSRFVGRRELRDMNK